jgi:hypothetical protein
MIKKRNLDPSLIQWIMSQTGLGPGVGELQYMAPATSATSQYRTQLEAMGVSSGDIHATLAAAYAKTVDYRNDVILVAPAAYATTPATTWARSNTHMLGMSSSPCRGYNPCYFTHTADQDVWITVSGTNNSFHNVRFQHGGTSTTNAHCLETTGAQNRFYDVHFDGPETTTEAAVSGYDLVKISEEHQNFFNCVFGNPWNAMTDVSSLVGFTGNKNATAYFKDSTFVKNAGAVGSLYLHTYQSINGGNHINFDNCSFQNTGTTTMTYAIDGYGLNTNNVMMFFNNCSFAGCTDVVAVTYEAYVWFSNNAVYAGNAQMNGLAANPDVS